MPLFEGDEELKLQCAQRGVGWVELVMKRGCGSLYCVIAVQFRDEQMPPLHSIFSHLYLL